MSDLYTSPLQASDDGKAVYAIYLHQAGYDGGTNATVNVGPSDFGSYVDAVDFEDALADFAEALRVASNFDTASVAKIVVSTTIL